MARNWLHSGSFPSGYHNFHLVPFRWGGLDGREKRGILKHRSSRTCSRMKYDLDRICFRRRLPEAYFACSCLCDGYVDSVRAFDDQQWTTQTNVLIRRREAGYSVLVRVGHWESHGETDNAGTPTRLCVVPNSASFIDDFLSFRPTVRRREVNAAI